MRRLGGFSPTAGDCNCCTCTDCCSGSAPDEFDVTIALADESCGVCDSYLSATYTLGRTGAGDGYSACRWRFSEGIDLPEYPFTPDALALCDPGCAYLACWYIFYRQLTLSIYCTSETYYRIDLGFSAHGVYYPAEPSNTSCPEICSYRLFSNTWNWRADVARASFNCATASSQSIPFLSRIHSCINRNQLGICNFDNDAAPHWLCADSPAAALLSAA